MDADTNWKRARSDGIVGPWTAAASAPGRPRKLNPVVNPANQRLLEERLLFANAARLVIGMALVHRYRLNNLVKSSAYRPR